MKNHLLEKLHPNLAGGTPLNIFKILKNVTKRKKTAEPDWNHWNPVKHFKNSQKPNRKKVTGLLRSRVEKIEKISNCGQTMVKLIILEY